MPKFNKTMLFTVGATLAVIWAVNNIDALDVVKKELF